MRDRALIDRSKRTIIPAATSLVSRSLRIFCLRKGRAIGIGPMCILEPWPPDPSEIRRLAQDSRPEATGLEGLLLDSQCRNRRRERNAVVNRLLPRRIDEDGCSSEV